MADTDIVGNVARVEELMQRRTRLILAAFGLLLRRVYEIVTEASRIGGLPHHPLQIPMQKPLTPTSARGFLFSGFPRVTRERSEAPAGFRRRRGRKAPLPYIISE